jgi:23S rRNA-/tRNA-specific pseudouridylate synthase
VTCDFLIKGGHELTHTVHRHEPAVAVCDLLLDNEDDTTIVMEDREKQLIRIVHESDSVIVVDKPSTLPIHPCGGYNYNSLIHILTSERPDLKEKVFTVHRLDRLTSGLTIFAKSTEVAKSMGKCIMDRDHCQKVYLARVKGKFPLHVPPELRTKSCSPDQPNNVPPFVHGEKRMNSATSTMNNDSKQHASSEGENSRSNFGLGFWVTDASGTVHENATLTSVFESGSSIETLLSDLEKETTNNQPDTSSSLPGDDGISSTPTCKETDSPNEEKEEASSGVYWFHLACPTRIAVKKTGICEAGSFSNLDPSLYRKTVKPAQTSFAVVGYDAKTDSTVVLCKPVTGRTHQIRLHLEYMGHPIANDPNYSGEIWFGDEKGERLYKECRIKLDNDEQSNSASNVVVVHPHPDNATTTDVPATEEEVLSAANCARIEGESLLDFIKKTCVWCARSKSEDCTMLEFLVRSRGIWLHALQYCIRGVDGQQKCYRTDSPAWSHI